MKFLSFHFLAFAFLLSCGDSPVSTTTPEIIPTFEYKLTSTWNFAPETSKVTWNRVLDQKATKKKVKLFGAMVDMEMGPVKMNMSGNVIPKDGGLTDENDTYKSGFIVFDMATFKFAREKNEGLFNVTDYPNSTLEFLSFSPSQDSVYNYNAAVKLTIQEHSEEFDIKVNLRAVGKDVQLKSTFSFNTLDFPLRDNTTKKEVNKDEITVKMDLNFNLGGTQKDSVRTN